MYRLSNKTKDCIFLAESSLSRTLLRQPTVATVLADQGVCRFWSFSNATTFPRNRPPKVR